MLFRSPKPQTPNPKPQTPNPKPLSKSFPCFELAENIPGILNQSIIFMNLVKLTDLDDYLSPAQDCIVLDASKSKAGKAKISIEDELAPPKKPNLIKQKDGETKGTVNLYDCLACSGCVTSSEVVLMEVNRGYDIATRSQELY